MNRTGLAKTDVDIDVAVELDDWTVEDSAVEEIVLRAAQAALAVAENVPEGAAELTVILTDDATVQELNRQYRGQDKPTNVLSFALHADAEDDNFDFDPAKPEEMMNSLAMQGPVPVMLGDVFLAFETVAREAEEQRKLLADHLAHLVIHGVLHLLGYDHLTDPDAERMERLETRILAELGIADPYAGRESTDGCV